jgi:hypothetical protein
MIKIKKIGEINLEDINLSKNNNLVYINRDNPIIIKTPPLYCCSGLREKKKKTKYSSYYFKIEPQSITKTSTGLCTHLFESIDYKMVELGKKNKENWFSSNKKILYKSLFENNNKIQFNLINSKEFNTLVFDENNQIIPYNQYLEKLSGKLYLQLVIELVGIWIKNDKYGLYIRLHEIKLFENLIDIHIPIYQPIETNNMHKLNEDDNDDSSIDYVLSDSEND